MSNKIPLQLPFAPKVAYRVTQGNHGVESHHGSAAFCWDFALADGDSTGQPVFAAAPGEVVDKRPVYFYVKHAEGEFAVYMHCISGSVQANVGDNLEAMQEIAHVGTESGGGPIGAHLHFALSNVVGLPREEDGGASESAFRTIPAEFVNYEVFDETAQDWKFVASGVPKQGELVRRAEVWLAGTEGPAAVALGGAVDVFERGCDRRMWHTFFDGRHWSGWEPNLGEGTFTSGPAATVLQGNPQLFARGDDRNIWHNQWNGERWIGWQPDIGEGTLSSAPAAISIANTVEVFARGDDRNIWHTFFDGQRWTGWTDDIAQGTTFSSGPAAIVLEGNPHLFARGDDGDIWHNQWNGEKWIGWQPDIGAAVVFLA